MTTYQAKKNEVPRQWHIINLEGQVLGRAATCVAKVLRGKNKPQFTRHIDTGDFVVAVNASKLKLTGNKLEDKFYFNYSGYPGGMSKVSAGGLIKYHPERIFHDAVKGMLPKNTLALQMIKKLKVYSGDTHPHAAQKPVELKP